MTNTTHAANRIAEEIRKDITREKMTKREIIASYKRVAKGCGLQLNIPAIFAAVEEGSM